MVASDPPEYDEETGRLLDEDSDKMKCPMYYGCPGTPIKIFAPWIKASVVVPPASKDEDMHPSLYHQAPYMYGFMLSHDDPDALDAFKGDFVVQIQQFDENDNPSNKEDRYYVGLAADCEKTLRITETILSDPHLPQGLTIVAKQEFGRCPECKQRLDVIVWAEPQDPTGDVDWDRVRQSSSYMEQIREQEEYTGH